MAVPMVCTTSSPVCADSCHVKWSAREDTVESVFSIGGNSLTSRGTRGR